MQQSEQHEILILDLTDISLNAVTLFVDGESIAHTDESNPHVPIYEIANNLSIALKSTSTVIEASLTARELAESMAIVRGESDLVTAEEDGDWSAWCEGFRDRDLYLAYLHSINKLSDVQLSLAGLN